MIVSIIPDGLQLRCQGLPSFSGESAGQDISFTANAPQAVTAIKASVNQRQGSIQFLMFVGFQVSSIFPPQQYWISVNTPRLRNLGLFQLYNSSPQNMDRALALRDSGHNSAGEIVTSRTMRVALPTNCHAHVRLWASINEFLTPKCKVVFSNCPRPHGDPMRLMLHLSYICPRIYDIKGSSSFC
jgi:hypothetical protein